MNLLITGGAGYIGSVTAAHLLAAGHSVRVLDDLSTGHRAAVPAGADFVEGSVHDASVLSSALADVDAVVHFASRSLVGESVQKPLEYFQANVGGALSLLAAMRDAGVNRLVFSSSAAVYGEPSVASIDESVPLAPVNPYGWSKLMIERAMTEQANATGLCAISLRYFNACGADGDRGEDHRPETHLVPRLCAVAMGRRDDVAIHGDDFDTPDGTAVRDYVHVADLARAHGLALAELTNPGHEALNLGSGTGSSVREVVSAMEQSVGHSLELSVGPRRDGDPPRLVAAADRAADRLGWRPEKDLPQIVADALAWHRSHPDGYPE